MNLRNKTALPIANRADWNDVLIKTENRVSKPLPLTATAFDEFSKKSAPKVQRVVKTSHRALGIKWS
jgi:hypothetical protein